MTHHLVVTRPFLDFVRGDIIAETAIISDILSNEHKKFVIKVALPNTSKG
jgi:hypothetical protein